MGWGTWVLLGVVFSNQYILAAQVSRSVKIGGPESVSLGRYQPVIGTRGMVVADDREAAEWGTEILRQGGNAIDAAVATAFAMSVTRPHYASIGGGGFLVYCTAPTSAAVPKCQTIDYREKAPAAATRDLYIRQGKAKTELSQNGALASGIPGVPAGLLFALEKYGTLSRDKILRRPILLAQQGYLFSPHSEEAAALRWSAMNEAAKKIFGCSGKPCPPGTLIRQPDLAKVLKKISASGKKGFYEGPIAQTIVREIRNAGGILTLEDLKTYTPVLRDPIQIPFLDGELISMPPPSSGGPLLAQLFGYSDRAYKTGEFNHGFGSSETLHALVHGMSLAYSDRSHYFGDPDFVSIPLSQLLSKNYLDLRWETFNSDKANPPDAPGELLPEPQNTTHLSVIDRHGNAVSLTTTVNDNFGSGFVPAGTGIVMNNEMDDFSISPGTPNLFGLVGDEANAIHAGKRPLSSMSPTIVRDSKGNIQVVIGAAGGPRIATSVFQSIFNHYYFGMPLIDAVAAPRVHHQWKPPVVYLESNGFPNEVQAQLIKKGYKLEMVSTLGKVHALERLPNGRVSGAPDFRGEGAAVAE